MRASRSFLGFLSLLGAVAMADAPAQAQTTRSAAADSAGAHQAAVGFLAAFDSVKWEPFTAYFADDVTMFFPFGDTPARADGRAAVEARFRRFFDEGRAAWARSGRPGEPRLGIVPRDLRVQMAGGDVAIVTFHLGAENPSRRSVVFHREADGAWKVIHWHASSAPQRAPAATPPAAAPPTAPPPAS
jgi:ketosteroid isomerase-like protein